MDTHTVHVLSAVFCDTAEDFAEVIEENVRPPGEPLFRTVGRSVNCCDWLGFVCFNRPSLFLSPTSDSVRPASSHFKPIHLVKTPIFHIAEEKKLKQ